MTNTVAKRAPGSCPNVSVHVERIRDMLGKLDEKDQAKLKPIVDGIIAFAQVQAELNRRLWEQYGSLPSAHGMTHTGGGDNIISDEIPQGLVAGGAGLAGIPQLGASSAGHVHPVTVGTPVGLGPANDPGVATTFNRSDHVHEYPDHGVLTGLEDDDHPQYLTEKRHFFEMHARQPHTHGGEDLLVKVSNFTGPVPALTFGEFILASQIFGS